MEQTLQKILDAVEENKKSEYNGNSGWISALVAGVLVAIVTAVYGFFAWQRGKELAKLKHEAAVAEEREYQALVDATIAATDEQREAAMQKVAEAEEALRVLRQQELAHRAETYDAINKLNLIVSWDDVDSYLAGDDPGSAEPPIPSEPAGTD
jgi:hypothetical protein